MTTVFLVSLLLLFPVSVGAQSFTAVESRVEQGGLLIVQIDKRWCGPESPNVSLGIFGKRYLPNKNCAVLVGVSIHTEPKYHIATLVDFNSGERLNWDYIAVEVLGVDFPKTRTARYSGRPAERKDRQKKIIEKAYGENELIEDLTDGWRYVDPMDRQREVVDSFGFIYSNNQYLEHRGVDLRAPVGTLVRAVNRGKIVLVAKRFGREGNMIIIAHGSGVFSVYMHLSRFGEIGVSQKTKNGKVVNKKRQLRVGDMVERGQKIGLSGTTGAGARRISHLHWGIQIRGVYINPLVFGDTINGHIK